MSEGSPNGRPADEPSEAPTEAIPTPGGPPADAPPPASPPPDASASPQAGLISAAPVGWGPSPGTTPAGAAAGQPGATQPAPEAPTVAWTTTPTVLEVPGAPGLVFADTGSRFVGFIVDVIIVFVLYIILGVVAATIFSISVTASDETLGRSSLAVSGLWTVILTLVDLVYFVFFWTGGRRATPGQRLFDIQIGNAFDGRGLTIDQAVRRWLGYGTFLALLALIPSLATASSGLQLLWVVILLVTTVTSPTKQGLHDKFANSAAVRRAGAGSGASALLACGVIVLLIVVVMFVGLIFLGSQMSSILSAVGESI